MRTALILLFLLAVAAVPGSLLPQRPLNPDKTAAYIASHGAWGRFLDALGMFDVFGSVWFAAIYLLLFVSLVGCLDPAHPRARPRGRPQAAAGAAQPRPAARVGHRSRPSASPPSTRPRRARRSAGAGGSSERAETSGAITLSAEKGYSRETGNLIFHVALLVSLVLIAVGRLYSYQGSKIVVQGTRLLQHRSRSYDSWKPGRFAAEGKVSPAPFCIDEVTKFTAKYTSDGEPIEFRADVTYRPTLDSPDGAARLIRSTTRCASRATGST